MFFEEMQAYSLTFFVSVSALMILDDLKMPLELFIEGIIGYKEKNYSKQESIIKEVWKRREEERWSHVSAIWCFLQLLNKNVYWN